MGEYIFARTGAERKELVNAISEFLNTKAVYLKTPTYAYSIGDIHIDKNGTGTGEFSHELLASLAEQGFVPTATDAEALPEAEVETAEEHVEPEAETDMEENAGPDFETEAGPKMETASEETAEADTISITVPLEGFTPERLDILCKLVLSKETLLKKALGVDALPIKVLQNGIEFPWFRAEHSDDLMAYAQLISALCTTAKEKKRVTAKPQESYDNEKFALRVYLLGLGLIGGEFGRIRKLLGANLSGNSSWRYGTPDKAVTATASAPQTAEENHADETPAEEKGANVGDIIADIAEESGAVSDEQ